MPGVVAEPRSRLSFIAPAAVQSEIRAMSVECDRVGGINLAQGICDTEVPAAVAAGAHAAIEDGYNIYTRLDGIADLRTAVAAKLESYNSIPADPTTEVLITNGATGALYATLLALLNPGDEVVIFEPLYGYHVSTLLSLRMIPVAVALTAPQWTLDVDALRAALSDKTRAVIVNTPSNPAGKVFSRAELEAVAEIAMERDLLVITDEIYEYFVYDGAQHVSMATLPGMRDRTITISGLSKTFSVTGWRVGYLTAPAALVPAIGYFHDLVYICSPSVAQYGALEGLRQLAATPFYTRLASDHQAKRDQLCGALTAAGFNAPKPNGAYYIFADASRVEGETAPERARALLRQTGVAAVAGSAFFANGRGQNLLRFCFGKRQDDLDRACAALQAV